MEVRPEEIAKSLALRDKVLSSVKEQWKEMEDRMKRFNICLNGTLGGSRDDGEKALF